MLATTRPLGSATITNSIPVVVCSCATAAGNAEPAVRTGARRTTGFAARYSASKYSAALVTLEAGPSLLHRDRGDRDQNGGDEDQLHDDELGRQ